MAMKSVIDVQVNAEQFKAFYELFEEYQKHLGSMPEDWSKIDEATKKAAVSFGAMSGAAVDVLSDIAMHTRSMSEDMKKAIKAQKEFGTATRTSSRELKKMAGYAKSLGHSIFGIGKYLFKIGALGGGISLLGGFGMRELGEAAVSGQRSARGIGLNQGQLKAWKIDMGRYVDQSMLNKVAGAQTTPQGLLSLSIASGLPMSQVASMSPDQLALGIVSRERQFWKNTPKGMQTMMPQWTQGYSQFSSVEEARRLSNTSASDLAIANTQYRRDASTMNISDEQTAAWYKFTRELSVAGGQIQSVLTRRLSELAPYMGQFVNSITKDAQALIESALSPENMKAMSKGFEEMAKYLGSPTFIDDMRKAGQVMHGFIHALEWVAKKLGWIPAQTPEEKKRAIAGNIFKYGVQAPNQSHIKDFLKATQQPATTNAQKALSALDASYGLKPGMMDAIWSAESSRGRNVGPSSAGALGPFQLMPANASGINPFDFTQSSRRAAELMRANMRKYKNDVQKSAAAYNWGSGNLDRDIAMHGNNWMAYAPNETQRYVSKIMEMLARRQASPIVRIENNTSARVAVQANAAAY